MEELHDTPSIEANPAAATTERHQMRDTLPHVEIGAPSMEGLEPDSIPKDAPAPAFAKIPGLGGKMASLPSLKNHAQNAPTAATVVAEPQAFTGPIGPIDDALLQRVWREITDERRAQDRMSEYFVLNRPIAANDEHLIELEVDNPIQVDLFNEMRTEFMGELRRRTKHPRLNVQVSLSTAAPTARKLYTSSDKFEYLAEKFPALREAKQRLGLEADF